MKRKKIAILAMAMVAIMMVMPLTVLPHASSANNDPNLDPSVNGSAKATANIPQGERYMYVLTTNTNNNAITAVQRWTEGKNVFENAKPTLTGIWNMSTGAVSESQIDANQSAIKSIWDFDPTTGLGPFNSFYAAINVSDNQSLYIADEAKEHRLNTAAGAVAYVLDPNNLKYTLMGTAFDTALYNVMLVIPTVYWYSDATHLYMTNMDPSVGTNKEAVSTAYAAAGFNTTTLDDLFTNLKAYAHTLKSTTYPDGHVYPYIAMGVYEAHKTTSSEAVGENKIVSQTGTLASGSGINANEYRRLMSTYNIPITGSAYQMWNIYQWTLYKMMAFTVMGSMNEQQAVAPGIADLGVTAKNPSTWSGSTDGVGFVGMGDGAVTINNGTYITTTHSKGSSAKVFLENTWAGGYEFIGDMYRKGNTFYYNNYLGGAQIGPSADPHYYDQWNTIGQMVWYSGNFLTDPPGLWSFPGTESFSGTDSLDNPYTENQSGGSNNESQVYVGFISGVGTRSGITSVLTSWSSGTESADRVVTRLTYVMTEAAVTPSSGYTLTYDKGDGISHVSFSIVAGASNKHTVIDNIFDKPSGNNKDFLGWTVDKTVTESTTWYYPGETLTVDGNMTLYAQFGEAKKITINFGEHFQETGTKTVTIRPGAGISLSYDVSFGYHVKDTDYYTGGEGLNVSKTRNSVNIETLNLQSDTAITLIAAEPNYYITLSYDSNEIPDLQYALDNGSFDNAPTDEQIIDISSGIKHVVKLKSDSVPTLFYSTDGASWERIESSGFVIKSNATIFVSKEVEVTFNGNGAAGSMATIKAIAGTDVVMPENSFGYTGYTFTEWNDKSDGTGTPYTPGETYVFSNSTILYAQWTAKQYTVTLDANGASTAGSTSLIATYNSGDFTGITAPQRTGYTFIGYFTDSTGGSMIIDPSDIDSFVDASVEGYLSSGKWVRDGEATLYAHWDPITVKATFIGNYSGSEYSEDVSETYDCKFSLPGTNPERIGYSFAGWFTDGTEGTEITTETDVAVVVDTTFYAHWVANKYGATFKGNYEGSTYSESVEETYDAKYVFPTVEPSRTGYSFAGWFTDASEGTEITTETDVKITAETDYYAHWTANKYDATFVGNYEGSTYSETIEQTYDSTYILPTTEPSWTGHAFIGWFDAVTEGNQIGTSSVVTTASAHTLYAHWADVPETKHTVTFMSNGIVYEVQNVDNGRNAIKLDPPSGDDESEFIPANSRFVGWFDAPTGGVQFNF